MQSNLDLSKFWCWQKNCLDYGKKGAGNIVLKERYGKDNRALLKCKTCSHCFSETHGTPFFGLNTSMDEVCRTLAEMGLVFRNGFLLHRWRQRTGVGAGAVSAVDDAQAGHLARPVRHVRLRGMWPLHHLVPRGHRHHRGSPGDPRKQTRLTKAPGK